jgi:hypothetical protein
MTTKFLENFIKVCKNKDIVMINEVLTDWEIIDTDNTKKNKINIRSNYKDWWDTQRKRVGKTAPIISSLNPY